MKSHKEYRFNDNPLEKEFFDKFKEKFGKKNSEELKTLSATVFGWKSDRQNIPNRWLTEDEANICANLIQWLGSPVGQGFLRDLGFERVEE